MLSQTVEYALRAMIHLASLTPDSSVNSKAIADHTQVPKGYLSKILRDLVVAELITSQRGPNGGFTLARTPAQISMLDVVNAVDQIDRITKCPLGNPEHVNLCPLHRRLDDALAMIEQELCRTSLAEILATNTKNSTCTSLMNPPVSRKK
ncbi:MAG: Rrf2 family transcriptional regulator [Phycisphaeraceae bacterium]|nr:Rrf2 family transcriptional regulator [Phycisphaeraceae bacterium]MCW5763550.1 Rrf2 family transcriptional regulator [Phycisphaeraceae bacterium]